MDRFELVTDMTPKGDQPRAIEALVQGTLEGRKFQTLLGVTGSGKTFTVANVVAKINRPTLVISHNKTLAAQLYSEFRALFPHNAVEYFVSYYDYYQPEAYVPQTDTYIEKDSSVNDDLDRLRLSATTSLLTRRDTIIVATVSCIYSLGDPEEYKDQMVWVHKGKPVRRDELLSWLIGIHYTRNDIDFHRGTFRARGDVVDVFPAYKQTAYRVELDGSVVGRIRELDPTTGETHGELDQIAVYPAKHFLTKKDRVEAACQHIVQEMLESVRNFQAAGKLLEAQRLESRTKYDVEMLRELGFCHGVENYARHLSGRPPGSRPHCLIDYFPKDFLMVVDESHVTLPQVRGMYEGDRARKETLVEYGFRLPSALDNRPQTFEEFESLMNQVICISATPGPYELQASQGKVVEQVIRPTGLVDPTITVKPTAGQVDDLMVRVRERAEKKERVLVTTLTKRMAEDLTRYLGEAGLRVKYLHSDIDAIERVEILRDLRKGEFDCLVGINLLREGLDLPEVSLVAVLDADKEGFLRSATSLIQVAGRAARHVNGEVILYADQLTGAMRQTLEETNRRRAKQLDFNQRNQITPTSIVKAIRDSIEVMRQSEDFTAEQAGLTVEQHEIRELLSNLEAEMLLCAKQLQFEKAASLRDEIVSLKEKHNLFQEAGNGSGPKKPRAGRRQP
jgi:excinuclease ABC subunit B